MGGERARPRAARRCWRRRCRGCGGRSATGACRAAASCGSCSATDARVDWEVAHAALGRARAALGAGDAAGALEAAGEAEAIAARGLLPELEAPWIDVRRAELGDLRAGGARAGRRGRDPARRRRRCPTRSARRGGGRAGAVPGVRARGADGGARGARQRRRGAARLRGRARAAARGARARPRARAASRCTSGCCAAGAPAARRRARAARPRRRAGLVERDARARAARAARGRGRGRRGPDRADRGPGRARQDAAARRAAAARRGGRRARAQRARASDLERDYPFGVVRQLLEGVLLDPAAAERALAGAAARRARCSSSRAATRPTSRASFAALHGLYWVCVNLAGERPLAVVSTTSTGPTPLRCASSPTSRGGSRALPVLLAATLRTGEPGTDLGADGGDRRGRRDDGVRPAPLSAAGGRRGRARAARPRRRRGVLPRLPHDHRRQPAAAAPAADRARGGARRARRGARRRRAGDRLAGDRASVVRRLSRLPADAGALARAVAVLGDGAELPAAPRSRSWPSPTRPRAAALLSRAEILRAETPLAFVHPLVRDAVYRDIPPGERELAHERAARLLRDAAAPADQIAGHLLLAPRRGEAGSPRRCCRRAATRCAAARPTPRRAPAARARRAAAGRGRGPASCSSSASPRCSPASRCGPTAARGVLRDGPRPRRAARGRARARAHVLLRRRPAPRGRRSSAARSPSCAGDDREIRLGLDAVRLSSVWFGAEDPSALAELHPGGRGRWRRSARR